ncbi:MAG TPA: hypothetical protein VME92_16685 [Acetobacteraceae bacterium]|nr:hypothetical protein [Acetobacteraceae bacterium]
MVTTSFILNASTAQLQQIFAYLQQNHIALALQAAVLPQGADGTGMNVEGYYNIASLQTALDRIQTLGGNLQYVTMDEPLYYGHQSTEVHAGQASITAVAQQAASTVALIKSVFADVQVGDTEPTNVPASDLQQFMQAFQQASGQPLAFVQADVDWNDPAWQSTLESWAATVRAAGSQFGVIYDGKPSDATSLAWTISAEQHMAAVEADPLIAPSQVLVDSWQANPSQLLPEGLPGTLTHVALETALVAPLYTDGVLTGGAGLSIATTVPETANAVAGYSVSLPGLGVGIATPNPGTVTFAVVITDSAGLLTAQASGAGTVSGAGSNVLTLTGSLADINAELAGLGYQAAGTGAETLDIATYDGAGMVDDHQLTVTAAAPVAVKLPADATAAALYQAIYGQAPTDADLAPVQTALDAGAPLAEAAAPWLAQAQATATGLLQTELGKAPPTAAVQNWTTALADGKTPAQLEAALARSAFLQHELAAVYTATQGQAPGATALAALTAQLAGGASLDAVEAPLIAGSAAATEAAAIGLAVTGQALDATNVEHVARSLIDGVGMAAVRGTLANTAPVQAALGSLWLDVQGVAATAAQLHALTARIANGASLQQVEGQIDAIAQREITALYRSVLGRAPSAGELASQSALLEGGRALSWLRTNLAVSAESETKLAAAFSKVLGQTATSPMLKSMMATVAHGTSLAGMSTELATIDSLSNQILGTAPDAGTIATMLQEYVVGRSDAQIRTNLAWSPASQQIASDAYQQDFGHAPKPGVLGGLLNAMAGGATLATVETGLLQQAAADQPVIGGVVASQTVSATGNLLPFAALTLTDPDPLQTESATVTLAPGPGTMTARAGAMSADGLHLTLSGTVGFVQNHLNTLMINPKVGAPAQLSLTVTNGIGNSSSASATISVETTTPAAMTFIYASAGNDQLPATLNPDLFVVGADGGQDVITGFNPAHDIIQLPAADLASFAAVEDHMTAAAGGTHIALSASSGIQLAGIAPSSLQAGNFHFA